MTLTKQQLGGIAQGIKSRNNAIEQYNLNPNFCIHCNSKIEVKEGQKVYEVKLKKFCNQSCSASFNNSVKPKRTKIIKTSKRLPKGFITDERTKGELFAKASNWQAARSTIQKRARDIFIASDKLKACKECGYDKHYEVCHIKSVSSFQENALIKDINHIDNLIALCPTHHWEFDNGILVI